MISHNFYKGINGICNTHLFVAAFAVLVLVVAALSISKSDDIAYESYWIVIKINDLDKPALISHVNVVRYYLRKVHATQLEAELNAINNPTNRDVLYFIEAISAIYDEYQVARQPIKGKLNPS